jgi:hypothetical protein
MVRVRVRGQGFRWVRVSYDALHSPPTRLTPTPTLTLTLNLNITLILTH